MNIINRLIKTLRGPSAEEKALWIRKKFIPAYRRLIDSFQGRCTINRALRTATVLLNEDDDKFDWVPPPMVRAFHEMIMRLEGEYTGKPTNQIVENAEDLLSSYFQAEQEVKLVPKLA